ncbi:oxidoreductase [Gluconobacter potus]|uniref:Oxidoreductase n=1 Tax=Gluconobacter potus TaxID=2724927 RepID=A0A149QVN3_9PROT|nr:SDR family oxidoreductase [Gluconobacter potus]KXV01362.1 oxidoreductase [Gluconobacter potus]
MNNSLQGKIVAITGASSGIGEATARLLARSGAFVVLGARRMDRLSAIVADIEHEGGKALALELDVQRKEQVQAFVDRTVTQFGRLDVFVNNAGVMLLAPLADRKIDQWERMIDVNIKGVLYGIAAALPVMQKQGSGHVINVSSVAGHKVGPGFTVYCGTKFAVRAISEGFRQEAGPAIRSTIISPGAVTTELPTHISDGPAKDAVNGMYAAAAISADAIANAIHYAISQTPDVDVNEIIIRPTAQEF